jgi:hypothetical protein
VAGVDPNAKRGSLAVDSATEKFDASQDPKVLQQLEINSSLQALQDQHDATMLGKLDLFNQTALGSMLYYQDLTLAAEEAKNLSLGQMGSELAMMAIQQGGALGKIGKAYAIAQTVWSTSTAIMKAMAEVPYPANIAAAAMVAAKGALQLANIKKTNLGASGTITAGGGGGAVRSAAMPDVTRGTEQLSTESQQKSATQVIINGNVFSSQETVTWMIEQIGAAVNNRDLVFISGNSRQALELAGAGG